MIQIFNQISFYLFIALFMMCLWRVLKIVKPSINLPFVVGMFFYRIPFVFIYYNFIPGDWIGYLRHARIGKLSFKWGSGTSGSEYLASLFYKLNINDLDLFFLYSLFGYFAVLIFYLIIHELLERKDYVKFLGINIFPWILLYPSLHMYTVMIGKDPVVLLGIAILTYGVFKDNNWIYIIIGALLTFLVRPHITIVLLVSLLISLIISKRVKNYKRIILFVIAAAIGIALIPIMLSFFRVSDVSMEAIQLAISMNEGYVSDAGTYVDMSSYPLIFKWFTYLFRPLFIDSPNVLLLEYSAENLFFLLLFLASLRVGFLTWVRGQHKVILFSLVFFILGSFVLSNGLSVFGLFIRQKSMVFLHFLLVIFVFRRYYISKQINNVA